MPNNSNKERNGKKPGVKIEGGKVETRARELVKPLIEAAGFFLWDVIFEKEGAMWYLRVLFDKEHDLQSESGITTEECERITAPVNALFDKEKFIENVDILEIGSPGLSRRLRQPEHFKVCLKQKIRAYTRGENGKTVVIYGVLENYNEPEDKITINTRNIGNDTTLQELETKKCIRINLDL